MKFIRIVFFIVLAVLAVPLSLNALSYLNFDPAYSFLRLKAVAIETGWYLPAYYAHVLVAALILLAGIVQIYPSVRRHLPRLHRWLGKFYVGGILFFAAPGGLIMSFFINRGPWVLASFLLQTAVWVGCTYYAYVCIRQKRIAEHQAWMLRSYAITLAAITLRLYAFLTSWTLDLSHPAAYGIIAWSSWLLNLLVCECYLRIANRKDTQQA